MRRTPAELALDPVGASRHLLARPLGAQLGDGIMPLGVRPDRNERIGGQDPERVPIHDEGAAFRCHVDLVAVGKSAHHLPLRNVVDRTKPPIDLFDRAVLVADSAGRQLPQGAVAAELDAAARAGYDLFEGEPPQLALPVRIVRGNPRRLNSG